MYPSIQDKQFVEGILTAGDRLWIPASLPASTSASHPVEPPQGHKDWVNAGKHTHVEALIKVWLIKYQVEIKVKGEREEEHSGFPH